ncbi:hypothetical protein CL176_00745 [Suicoccus acidiformans]|uniref:Rpn family recombination-promoting nuclease/putative transposase n=2 Tax=Suicoccus acidiformans TaxID=2036206 RepID=A0A347WHW4_9LACT|nr:hypothetical protein CL176_00745 [Suicoccus acidiformans]
MILSYCYLKYSEFKIDDMEISREMSICIIESFRGLLNKITEGVGLMYRPTNDFLFKKTFAASGQEDVTKALIEAILGREFTEITLTNPYTIEAYQAKGRPESTEVDLLARDSKGGYVTIEMQVQRDPFFLERVHYYAGGVYRKNYGRKAEQIIPENRYSSLKQVYSINILDFPLFPKDNEEGIRTFIYRDRENGEALMDIKTYNGIELTFVSLTNYNISEDDQFKHWWRFFKMEAPLEDAPDIVLKAYAEVDEVNLTEEERKMADLAQKYQDDFEAAVGTARYEGREEGRAEERYELVSTMHENGVSTEMIAEYTNMTPAEVKQILQASKLKLID